MPKMLTEKGEFFNRKVGKINDRTLLVYLPKSYTDANNITKDIVFNYEIFGEKLILYPEKDNTGNKKKVMEFGELFFIYLPIVYWRGNNITPGSCLDGKIDGKKIIFYPSKEQKNDPKD